ncbi:MAG: IPT/TIG domain-containing protein, partial [Verrucomicrobiales bacterium]
AVLDRAGIYTVQIPPISGPNGARELVATATDTSGNPSIANSPITVGGGDPVSVTLFTDQAGHFDAQPGFFGGGRQQSVDYDPIDLTGTGTITFTVTATPPVRREVQNISRADPYVRYITFNGESFDLRRIALECNDFGSDPAICSTSFEVTEPGTLDYSLLGPGTWNTFGEFSGHAAQDFVLEVVFTSVDLAPPRIELSSPARGSDLALGQPLIIELDVDDGEGTGIASVVLEFDANGDGETTGFNERIAATSIGGTRWRATFPALSGDAGPRPLTITATDSSFNSSEVRTVFGVAGTGGGESILHLASGEIPGQPGLFNGGTRQSVPFSGISVPGPGRLTFKVTTSPPVRVANPTLPYYDAMVERLTFDGTETRLDPFCNEQGSDPAICISSWDSPGAGTLEFNILGPAWYNIWDELQSTPDQNYSLEIVFRPGPVVDALAPSSGSIAGGSEITLTGSGFSHSAVVLFGGVPATGVTRVSGSELRCKTPPGVPGAVDVRVINSDPDGEPWNYGVPWGLFGTKSGGFTYLSSTPTIDRETLIGSWHGTFPAAGADDPQGSSTNSFNIPGPGRLRFETHAFKPIINPIPGPFGDRENLLRFNDSSSVTSVLAGNGSHLSAVRHFSDLRFPYGGVIANSTVVVSASHAGNGEFTTRGPARWNAFLASFDIYEMLSAPAQDWSTALWFANQPVLSSVSPGSGSTLGGETITLSGDQFGEGARVRFGANYATDVLLVSPTTLTCTAPPHTEGSVAVTVEYLDMNANLPSAYQYVAPPDDADGDGLGLLLERFLALDPATPDAGEAWSVTQSPSGAVEFTYRRARDTAGLSGSVEWSSDLKHWNSGGVVESTSQDNPGDEYTLVRASITLPIRSVYLRLRVTADP